MFIHNICVFTQAIPFTQQFNLMSAIAPSTCMRGMGLQVFVVPQRRDLSFQCTPSVCTYTHTRTYTHIDNTSIFLPQDHDAFNRLHACVHIRLDICDEHLLMHHFPVKASGTARTQRKVRLPVDERSGHAKTDFCHGPNMTNRSWLNQTQSCKASHTIKDEHLRVHMSRKSPLHLLFFGTRVHAGESYIRLEAHIKDAEKSPSLMHRRVHSLEIAECGWISVCLQKGKHVSDSQMSA